uniref:T9SS type A sorting domain-containing protein n=1 Tax=uncultured Psychroserpens sp. TaxID=255436 RepID=UPI002621AA16
PSYVCGGAVSLSFDLSATDDCGSDGCSGTFSVAGADPLVANCPAPVLLDSSSTEQEILDAYAIWSSGFGVTGGCNVTSNLDQLPTLPDFNCGSGVDLSFELTATGDCDIQSCESTFTVPGVTGLTVSCPTDPVLDSCATEQEIIDAYNIWVAGFSVNDGDNPTSNIGDIPSLPDFACGEPVNLNFTLEASDACTPLASCAASFTVKDAQDLTVSCPQDADVSLPSCSTEQEILDAYAAWSSGFGVTGGCNTVSNLGELPSLPSYVCGGAVSLSFDLSATDDCGSDGCSGTFSVEAAISLDVVCPAPVSLTASATAQEIADAYQNWIAGFEVKDGCDATSNLDQLPSLPDYVCGQALDIEFELFGYDACNPNGLSCVSTFHVDATDPVNAGNDGTLEVCEDDDNVYDLSDFITDEAAGGSWEGPNGAHDGTFNAQEDLEGTYTYTVQGDAPCPDDSSTVTVTINPLPEVTIGEVDSICIDADAVQLLGTPEGGTWSGTGVDENGLFDPSIAGAGDTIITYSYTDNGNGVQDCDALVLTAIYDGDLTGGKPKGVELYVLHDIPDLSIYGLGSANNGNASSGVEYTFPADEATEGTYIYVTTDAEDFNTWFGFDPTYVEGTATNINGDDAIELFKNGNVIDTYGVVGVNGDNEAWDYTDSWAYRNTSTGPDGTTYVEASWTYGGREAWDGETSNTNPNSSMPVGTYNTQVCNDCSGEGGTGCSNTSEITITVNDLPEVLCPDDFSVCVDLPAFTLELASPEGGEYSGAGVENGTFSPALANIGTHTITYTYTNDNTGCTNTCAFDIEVIALPEIISALPTCDDVYGTYSIDIIVSEGTTEVSSNFGNATDNGGDSWTINDIPEGQDVIITATRGFECDTELAVEAPVCICIELEVSHTDLTCFGLDDGTITVEFVTEGATVTVNGDPYDADMLYEPGEYTVTASFEGNDNEACIISEVVTIEEPAKVEIVVSSTDETCNGAEDGTITIESLSEGAFYTIKKNGIGPDLSGQEYFAPGIYVVEANLIDNSTETRLGLINGLEEGKGIYNTNDFARIDNPCVDAVLVRIEEGPQVYCKFLPSFQESELVCGWNNEFYIKIQTNHDPEQALTYEWELWTSSIKTGWESLSDGDTDKFYFVPGSGFGIFSVTVTDANGCSTTCSYKVEASCDEEDFNIEGEGANSDGKDKARFGFDFETYPNPTKGKVNVKFNTTITGNVTVELYNLVGTRMLSQDVKTQKGRNISINLSGMPSQVYYLKVVTNKGTKVKKVVVDK